MRKFLSLIIILIFSIATQASHIKAGEIIVKSNPTNYLRFEIDFILYFDTDRISGSNGVPIDELTVNLGDGSADVVITNPTVQIMANNVTQAIYTYSYTYSSPGTYIVNFSERYRVSSILNMTSPDFTKLYLESRLTIRSSGTNSSPVLTVPPIDIAASKKIYKHNPGAYDPDGDSLSFQLITPLQDKNTNVAGYTSPADNRWNGTNTSGGNASLEIDAKTGEITWNTPGEIGFYNIAIKINEYRRGNLIGYVIRDMQIEVRNNPNDPPVIVSNDSLCIQANTLNDINYSVSDFNKTDKITIEGLGSAFEVSPSPSFINLTNPVSNPYSGKLQWTPSCNLVREQPYQIILKATDYVAPSIQLSDLKTISVKIRGSKPVWTSIVKSLNSNDVTLNWKAYNNICNATGIQIRLYRAECDSTFNFDPCAVKKTIPTNYTLIASLASNISTYTDKNLKDATNYYYALIAYFPATADGVSFRSNIASVSFNNTNPLITGVSVNSNSSINVTWSYPDLSSFSPNFSYSVLRSTDSINFTTIFKEENLNSLSTTSYTDNSVDVNIQKYFYKIEYTANSDANTIFSSKIASTLQLTYTPLTASVKISWKGSFPYYINKIKLLDLQTNKFIDSTTNNNYFIVKNLNACDTTSYAIVTNQNYCSQLSTLSSGTQTSYIIKVTPLVETNLPFVTSIKKNWCDNASCTTEVPLPVSDTLIWPDLRKKVCNGLEGYNIYFKSILSNEYQKIGTTTDTFFVSFNDITRVGCYYVTYITKNSNNVQSESSPSSEICVNNDCYCYQMTNVVTPNNDGFNDKLTPLKYPRFVKSAETTIFNRWGVQVFKTKDILVNWDASNVESGTYYYETTIEKYSLDNHSKDFIKGNITVIK